MGKNHRHKKNLKSEKGKVKLKVKSEKTKFLPKGRNVTDLSFKFKQIILPEQLKEKEQAEIRSRRNLNCNELLSRLRHHNNSAKIEACEELGQILNSHAEELLQHYLSAIIKGLSVLILDVESKVRQAATKVITCVLKTADTVKIEPFFGIIFSYLKCALTNLNEHIQHDSLLVVDSLIEHVPNLVAKHAHNLVINLISLVSKLSGGSDKDRTLLVVMGKKLTSRKWRSKVLRRICKVLTAADSLHENIDRDVYTTNTIYAQEKGISCMPLYRHYDESLCSLKVIDFNMQVNESDDNLSSYGESLLGLLFEIWLEEVTIDEVKSDVTILELENIQILDTIVSIILILWKFMIRTNSFHVTQESMKKQMSSARGKKFWKKLLEQFPYGLRNVSGKTGRPKKGDKENEYNDPACHKQNLEICLLYLLLDTELKLFNQDNVIVVLNYLTGLLGRQKVPNEDFKNLCDCLDILLVKSSPIWTKKGLDLQEITTALLEYYSFLPVCSSKVLLFEIICKICLVPSVAQFVDCHRFLYNLPLILDNNLHLSALELLKIAVKQGNTYFNQQVSQHIPSILDVLKKSSDLTEYNKRIIEMFVYIPIDGSSMKLLKKFSTGDDSKSNLKKYVKTCLDIRSSN